MTPVVAEQAMQSKLTSFIILLLFILLTVCFTWPVVLHMKTAVKSAGDPFLNTWILAWDVHQLLTSPGKLFEANIFHPHPHTLAYSENLLASSLIAMPFILIWKSPVLGYNIVFLFSFIFSGWGMYLLIRELTGKNFAGIIGGIIFAFCPFRFGHLSHLHLLTIQWLPFTFLYFHRFIKSNKGRDLFLFTAFFLLLAFSSLHYALFAVIALFLALCFFLRRKHILKLALSAFLSAVVLFPAARMYFHVQKEMGFVRSVDEVEYYSAGLKNYLAAPGGNMLYGRITRRFSGHEKELFPGLTALVLSAFGFLACHCERKRSNLMHLPLRERFAFLLFYRGGIHPTRIMLFYLTVGIISFLFSLGPSFPLSKFCYLHIPGFSGMRVPARFAIMVVFSLSVLSGFGIAKILIRRKTALVMFILPILLLEYWSCPLSLYRVSREIPEVYKWLAEQDEDSVIVELPMPGSIESVHNETRYMYWSTFHWKRMVNGYSGFFPHSYWDMNKIMQSFPSAGSLSLLENLGVDYIIIHTKKFRRGDWERIKKEISESKKAAREGTFGPNYVYTIR